jgi:hypothetical protein
MYPPPLTNAPPVRPFWSVNSARWIVFSDELDDAAAIAEFPPKFEALAGPVFA